MWLGTPLLHPVDGPRTHGNQVLIELPHGPVGWVERSQIDETPVGRSSSVSIGLQLLGTPYRWGGRSPGGFDCSSLVQLAALFEGFKLPRDARQYRFQTPSILRLSSDRSTLIEVDSCKNSTEPSIFTLCAHPERSSPRLREGAHLSRRNTGCTRLARSRQRHLDLELRRRDHEAAHVRPHSGFPSRLDAGWSFRDV